MRLAAQEKLGFYPAPPDACEGLLKHLQLGKPDGKAAEQFILDPCAGQGEFINQLAEGLHIPQKNVHAAELDKGRGESIRLLMPNAQVLAPCSFFQTLIAPRSFGLIYCNPPFDHTGLGSSGREETEFIKECYNLLCDSGIIVVVSPLKTYKNRDFCTYIDNHFKSMMLYRFPEPQFNEVVMIGVKRSSPRGAEESYRGDGFLYGAYALGSNFRRDYDYERSRYSGINALEADLPALGTAGPQWQAGHPILPPVRPMTLEDHLKYHDDEIRVWTIPASYRPSRFAKGMYTASELVEVLSESPNNAVYRETKEPPIQESPLPLAAGHTGLVVASGALDGLIETPHGNHVMRGISRKTEKFNDDLSKATISEDGLTMKVVEVYSEEMDTRIRAVDNSHAIYTFTMQPRTVTGLEREYDVRVEQPEECMGKDVVQYTGKNESQWLKVRLNEEEDVEFLLDTGASSTVISDTMAASLQLLKTGKRQSFCIADGSTISSAEMIVSSLEIGRFIVRNVRVHAAENPGKGFTPLLGQNVLRLFNYSIDYDKSEISLSLRGCDKDE